MKPTAPPEPGRANALNVGSRSFARDERGYLVDPAHWDWSVAAALAREQGLELTHRHRTLLSFVRDWFLTHGETPDEAKCQKAAELARRHAFADESPEDKPLEHLFPGGCHEQVLKIAGLNPDPANPNPTRPTPRRPAPDGNRRT